nr:integrase, catalytic region, zinc finger, CCHC-type, peptidase aspartic, catalytic [Tanacetum cinerariifolium]
MFDELLNPQPSVVNQTPEAIAPIAEVNPPGYIDSTGSPSSITVEQDAPSTSNSPTPTETQSSVIPQDVRDDNLDIEVAHMGNDLLFGVPIPEVTFAGSVSKRTRRIVETIHVDFDELTTMASEHHSSGPTLNKMTPGTISSGLVPTSSPPTSFVPPSQNDWDLLFQPMFDELLNPQPSVVNQTPEAIAPIAEVNPTGYVDSTGSPSSTTVEQDAPFTSNSIEVAHMGNDSLFGVPIPEVTFAQSTTPSSPQEIVQINHPMPHHNSKWTKDHPLNNIIGQLSRPVSTRLQLHEQALFCYYDAFLTSVEPKTYKEALTQS